jgi:BolA protein
MMGKVADAMRETLEGRLAPTRLEIVDESDRHSGHSGAREGGESHFVVTIESAAFDGLKALARQRLVHGLLEAQLKGPVHALSLRLRAPGEG